VATSASAGLGTSSSVAGVQVPVAGAQVPVAAAQVPVAAAQVPVADAQVPVPTEQEGGGGGNAADPSVEPDMPAPPDAADPSVDQDVPMPAATWWPSDTDLVFIPGTNRLSLTIQHPPVRAVIQDSLEHIRIFLYFNQSFPDPATIPTVIGNSLQAAALESDNPMAPHIHDRLLRDDGYQDNLSRLVSVL